MANQEHVDLLKQGVVQWNAWRSQHPKIQPDLSDADLEGIRLEGANLSGADLVSASLLGANLLGANLSSAGLEYASLEISNLSGANLSGAGLEISNLSGALLVRANLSGVSLEGANLFSTNLNGVSLDGVSLDGARMWDTIIADVDLRETKGLVEIQHEGPSIVQLHTVQPPQDDSALHFLRGAGVPDPWIAVYQAEMMHPIQYHTCFIAYSSKDEILAQRLHADLQDHGVRCWFAAEDLKIGDRFHSRINEAIHLQDKLLLLLSDHAIQSDWVEIEVRAALEKEQRQHRDVLFPVRLDNSVTETSQAWAALLRQSRQIDDFTNWTDPQAYQVAFKRLLADLKKMGEQQDQETKP